MAWGPRLKAFFLRRKVPPRDAEDLIQETFLKVCRAVETFRRPNDLGERRNQREMERRGQQQPTAQARRVRSATDVAVQR